MAKPQCDNASEQNKEAVTIEKLNFLLNCKLNRSLN